MEFRLHLYYHTARTHERQRSRLAYVNLLDLLPHTYGTRCRAYPHMYHTKTKTYGHTYGFAKTRGLHARLWTTYFLLRYPQQIPAPPQTGRTHAVQMTCHVVRQKKCQDPATAAQRTEYQKACCRRRRRFSSSSRPW